MAKDCLILIIYYYSLFFFFCFCFIKPVSNNGFFVKYMLKNINHLYIYVSLVNN